MTLPGEKNMKGWDFSRRELVEFIELAKQQTYAGGAKPTKSANLPGFIELNYSEEKWKYQDNYSGFLRSRGMEVAWYEDTPVWAATYGGGMLKDSKEFARDTFKFLKKALGASNKGFDSFRGPKILQIGKWMYKYKQSGDVKDFSGNEIITFEDEKVFTHKIIGGMIRK